MGIKTNERNEYINQIIRPTGLIDPPVEIRPSKTQVDDLMHEARVIVKKGYRSISYYTYKKNGRRFN